MLILSDIIPFCAATRRNRTLVADDCAAVALARIEPDGSPTRPFPLQQVSTGSYLTVNRAPALPTAPSECNGIFANPPPALAAFHRYLFSLGGFHPATVEARAVAITERRRVKQAQLLHSLSKDDDEPPQLVSGDEPPQLLGGDTMAARVIERMERKGASAGPPVICRAHAQGLGMARGQADSYGAELNSREQRKAEAGAQPVLIPPIPELDQQRLISSKVSSICFSLCLCSQCSPLHCRVLDPPAAGIIHPRHRDAVRCITRFQCGPHIQLNSYCILSPVEDTSTTSRPSIQAP